MEPVLCPQVAPETTDVEESATGTGLNVIITWEETLPQEPTVSVT